MSKFKKCMIIFFLASVMLSLSGAIADEWKKALSLSYDKESKKLHIGDPLPGDKTSIKRYSDRIQVEWVMENLEPGTVYEVHSTIFNYPEFCKGTPVRGSKCSWSKDKNNKEVFGASYSFGGFVAEKSSYHWKGILKVDPDAKPIGVYEAGSPPIPLKGNLVNPTDSEVRLVRLKKGPYQPDNAKLQLNSLFGACGGKFGTPEFFCEPNAISYLGEGS